MSSNPYGTGIGGLLKKGWHLIPGVMGASVMGLLGLGIGIFAVATRFPVTLPPKYKRDYIVYRPDDPRAKVPVRDLLD
ncbi:hypothetical protein O3M35_011375 [Rhynocoris fuscipes]|uniref:NADH dehydrogenase [ubiquinone] 1 alpha subcomplex subunit 4-like 2 n=1 Tax=Rhynocoris fuscipes TaxID=488301 RepID=A0AAW1CYM1_9HEMI